MKDKKFIQFFKTKKYELKNTVFEKDTKYRVISETDNSYILSKGIEVDKDGEGALYKVGYIQYPENRR